jgi:predicted ATPase
MTQQEAIELLQSTYNMVFIMSGAPGSGKSTLADRSGLITFSADKYMVDHQGEYRFNPYRLGECHSKCFGAYMGFMGSMQYRETQFKSSCVIDNTNTQVWEAAPYISVAKYYDYVPVVVVFRSNYGNIHGVTTEKVQQMEARLQKNLADLERICKTIEVQ